MKIEYIKFTERRDRSCYIAGRFKNYIDESVLDIGCDNGYLKTLMPSVKYFGVDIAGKPDLTLNLEETVRLPFEDNSFKSVVCSDVLEHLDNLHNIFNELVRVSGRYIIISLPNNWCNARRPIEKGKGGFSFYGLPFETPADRHKWFFSLSDAEKFFKYQAEKHKLAIKELVPNEKPRIFPISLARRLFCLSDERYLNRYAHTLWVVFEKIF